MSAPSVPVGSQSGRHRTRSVALVVLAVAIIAFASLALGPGLGTEHQGQTQTTLSSGQLVLIVFNGTGIRVAPGQYYPFKFSITLPENVTGSFIATNGATAYIMNVSSFASYSSGSSPPRYVYTTGEVINSSIDVTLEAGSYYLVFANPNALNSTQVIITESFAATS